jgi:mRNA interferase MazF
MIIVKNFFDWIHIKIKLHDNVANNPLFKQGEIWWVSLGENINNEMNGKGKDFCRPVLIFKKLSKNTFLGIPLSTKNKKGTWYVSVNHNSREVVVVLSQVRVLDSRRMLNRIGILDEEDFKKVKTGFASLFL